MTLDGVIGELQSGMTIGIGGWGSRRKPMALVRALAASGLSDLTIVSFGGPDVGLLVAAGKVRRLVAGFVSLDSIPLEPHFRQARQRGAIEFTELDEGMLHWGLLAAAHRLPFLPMRAGLGSDVLRINPQMRTVRSPYADGEEFVAVPALPLDAAFVHMNRADTGGNGQYLGPDPYFDDLYCLAAQRAYMSCERIVPTAELLATGPSQSLLINRAMVAGVVETPNGAHFTSCVPDYDRDEEFQARYASAAGSPATWDAFAAEYLSGTEADYQAAVAQSAAVTATTVTATTVAATTVAAATVAAASGATDGRTGGQRWSRDASVSSAEPTLAEICVVACAEAWRGDGAILASPMGLIPVLGARLAQLTFEPDLLLTDGEATLLAPAAHGQASAGERSSAGERCQCRRCQSERPLGDRRLAAVPPGFHDAGGRQAPRHDGRFST